jgi:GNAT superfamily N-acetyltransferase
MYEIINDAAQAYKGVIPEDRWHEPYMPIEELKNEIDDGVEFWGYEAAGKLMGVMGLQDKGDVYLIRHSYVRTRSRNLGIGTKLLRHLEQMTGKPILIGTWADGISPSLPFGNRAPAEKVLEDSRETGGYFGRSGKSEMGGGD